VIETSALTGLEFRYLFSERDDVLAFKVYDGRKRRQALTRAARHFGLMAVGVALAVIVGTVDLVRLIGLAVSIAAFAGGVEALARAIRQRTKIEPFEPIEIVTSVSERGVSNRTPYVFQEAAWAAVKRVDCLEYGIAFEILGARWYVPRSAFGSVSEMHAACKKIRAYKDLVSRPMMVTGQR